MAQAQAMKTLSVRVKPELWDKIHNLSGKGNMTGFVNMALDATVKQIEKTLTPQSK